MDKKQYWQSGRTIGRGFSQRSLKNYEIRDTIRKIIDWNMRWPLSYQKFSNNGLLRKVFLSTVWLTANQVQSRYYVSLFLAAPEGDIVPHELQDHGALLVVLLVDCVDVGDRLLEGAIRQLQRPLPLLPHLPKEDRGVEVQREAHGIGLRQVGARDLLGLGVVVAGLLEVELAGLVVFGVLAEVAIEVGEQFAEEDDGLCALDVVLVGDDFLLDQLDEVVAHLCQLLLDLALVLLEALPHPLLLARLPRHRLNHLQLCPP